MLMNTAAATLSVLADRLEALHLGTPAASVASSAAAEMRFVAGVPALQRMPLDFQDCIRAFLRIGMARPTDHRDGSIAVRRAVALTLFRMSGDMAVGTGQYGVGSALRLSDAYRAAVDHLTGPGTPHIPYLIASLNREIVELEVAA